MSRQIDFSKPLSDEDRKYVIERGNPIEMRQAGLVEDPNFDLSDVPGSLMQHEIDGTGEPTFDLDSKVADESVGEPGAMESSLLAVPEPAKMPKPVPFKADSAPAKQAPKTGGKATA